VFEGIWVELADGHAGERKLGAQFVLRRPIGGGPLSWLPAGKPIEFNDHRAIPTTSGRAAEPSGRLEQRR
jgi:hypothetical protein